LNDSDVIASTTATQLIIHALCCSNSKQFSHQLFEFLPIIISFLSTRDLMCTNTNVDHLQQEPSSLYL